jgi:hypothetical protein
VKQSVDHARDFFGWFHQNRDVGLVEKIQAGRKFQLCLQLKERTSGCREELPMTC